MYETIEPYSRLLINGTDYDEYTNIRDENRWLTKNGDLILMVYDDEGNNSEEGVFVNSGLYIVEYEINGIYKG